ncbi:uncharacterized protein LOC125178223 [Hyalella azteca]|uniref:Uncharacterized protein LOC125178223 n=1 Tax=Hyalella azteca TaxID=294128 RepID=A0A979FK93_HYAAZ|nr:uncharacterized protein LOC125178223 [Hyalella azteca]
MRGNDIDGHHSEDSDADYDGHATPEEECRKPLQKVALHKGFDTAPEDFDKDDKIDEVDAVTADTDYAGENDMEPPIVADAPSSTSDVPIAKGINRNSIKRSSMKGIKEMFSKSKKYRKNSKNDDVPETAEETTPENGNVEEFTERKRPKFFSFKAKDVDDGVGTQRGSKKSKYSIIRKKRIKSSSSASVAKTPDSDLRENLGVESRDPQGSSDSDPLISEDPVMTLDSLEFENLPLSKEFKNGECLTSPVASNESTISSDEELSFYSRKFTSTNSTEKPWGSAKNKSTDDTAESSSAERRISRNHMGSNFVSDFNSEEQIPDENILVDSRLLSNDLFAKVKFPRASEGADDATELTIPPTKPPRTLETPANFENLPKSNSDSETHSPSTGIENSMDFDVNSIQPKRSVVPQKDVNWKSKTLNDTAANDNALKNVSTDFKTQKSVTTDGFNGNNATEAPNNTPDASNNAPEVSNNAPEAPHNATEVSNNAPEASNNAPEAPHNATEASNYSTNAACRSTR